MSTVTHFNPDSIYGFDSADTGSMLVKGSGNTIDFQTTGSFGPLICEFTERSSSPLPIYSCNVSVSDILTAHSNGRLVIGVNVSKNPRTIYRLTRASGNTQGSGGDVCFGMADVGKQSTNGRYTYYLESMNYSSSANGGTWSFTYATDRSHGNIGTLDKIPTSLGTAGQYLGMNSAATGIVWNSLPIMPDYSPEYYSSVPQQNQVNVDCLSNSKPHHEMVTISADTDFSFDVWNNCNNILWVLNESENDILFSIDSVLYCDSPVTMFAFPDEVLSFKPNSLTEIGLICDTDGAKFSWRNDLIWTSTNQQTNE